MWRKKKSRSKKDFRSNKEQRLSRVFLFATVVGRSRRQHPFKGSREIIGQINLQFLNRLLTFDLTRLGEWKKGKKKKNRPFQSFPNLTQLSLRCEKKGGCSRFRGGYFFCLRERKKLSGVTSAPTDCAVA